MNTTATPRMPCGPLDGRRPRIVVLDDWERALERRIDWTPIRARADVELHHRTLRGQELDAATAGADVLVLVRDRTPIDADAIARMPALRYVMFTGARNTRLDMAALAARGIPVSGTDWGPSKASTCELTWALILAATKRLEDNLADMRDGGWRGDRALPMVLEGARLGLVGLGNIGSRVAAVGKAFGMEIVAWSPNMTAERAAAHGATHLPLDTLLATSDVVSLHLVPGPGTRGLLDASRLASMKPGSVLVNTSRAALIDMDALPAALAAGRPAQVALDVYEVEPLPADHPLRRMPKAVLTPHLGFVTEPVFDAFATGVGECLHAWMAGGPVVRRLETAG